eukprot:gene1985-biopygen1957
MTSSAFKFCDVMMYDTHRLASTIALHERMFSVLASTTGSYQRMASLNFVSCMKKTCATLSFQHSCSEQNSALWRKMRST